MKNVRLKVLAGFKLEGTQISVDSLYDLKLS